jgi:hypothetical protein
MNVFFSSCKDLSQIDPFQHPAAINHITIVKIALKSIKQPIYQTSNVSYGCYAILARKTAQKIIKNNLNLEK